MRTLVVLYLKYLELVLIGMLVTALAITLAAGLLEGGIALGPAVLANTTLIVMGLAARSGLKTLREHPEIHAKPFKGFRLLMLTRKNKFVLVAVLILMTLTLGATYQANRLLLNQAIVGAGMGIPATFFNQALVIDVLEISPGDDGSARKVTAVLHSDGYPDVKIEGEGVGYQTTYIGRNRFNVRIVEVNDIYAKFFVERVTD